MKVDRPPSTLPPSVRVMLTQGGGARSGGLSHVEACVLLTFNAAERLRPWLSTDSVRLVGERACRVTIAIAAVDGDEDSLSSVQESAALAGPKHVPKVTAQNWDELNARPQQ